MRFVSYAIAALVAFLGIIFLSGNQGSIPRLIVGGFLIIGAIVIVYLTRVHREK